MIIGGFYKFLPIKYIPINWNFDNIEFINVYVKLMRVLSQKISCSFVLPQKKRPILDTYINTIKFNCVSLYGILDAISLYDK